MSNDSIEVGRIVISKAGRDAGTVFMITAVLDGQYVEVANGTLRKLAKPKKKKLRHLEVTPLFLENIREKIEQGKKVFDAELRSAIIGTIEPQKEE